MPSITFVDAVTHVPADWANSVDAIVFDVFNGAQTVEEARAALGLGGLGTQEADDVDVSGGVLNGVSIGLDNPGPAHFNWALITELPVDPRHAANKRYVDSLLRAGGDPFVFQVGGGSADHYHVATLSQVNAKALVNGTANQFVVTTDEVNGHTHDITIVIDRGTATMEVSNITNNGSDQHTADVINKGAAGGGGGSLEFLEEGFSTETQLVGTASAQIPQLDWDGMPTVAWNGTLFCMVAPLRSSCWTSPDGITWTERTNVLPSDQVFVGIAWSGAVFCVLSENGNTYTSTTGTSAFTPHIGVMPAVDSGVLWADIAFTANGLVAISGRSNGNPSDVAAVSTVGVSWVASTLPHTYHWSRVSAIEGTVLAIAEGEVNVARSDNNGTTWGSEVINGIMQCWRDLAPGVNGWMVVPTDHSLSFHFPVSGGVQRFQLPVAGNWTVANCGNNLYYGVVENLPDLYRIDLDVSGETPSWKHVGTLRQSSDMYAWKRACSNGSTRVVIVNDQQRTIAFPFEDTTQATGLDVRGEEATVTQEAGSSTAILDVRTKWAKGSVTTGISQAERTGLSSSPSNVFFDTIAYDGAPGTSSGYNEYDGSYHVVVPKLGRIEVEPSGSYGGGSWKFTPYVDDSLLVVPKILYHFGFNLRIELDVVSLPTEPYRMMLAALESSSTPFSQALWRHDFSVNIIEEGGFFVGYATLGLTYLWELTNQPVNPIHIAMQGVSSELGNVVGTWQITELGRSRGMKLA